MNMHEGIVFLTPGTGVWYCGACIRDNSLAKSLHAAGHRVSVLPMYLPHRLDEEALAIKEPAPVFFGGINLYLRSKSKLFHHMPRWLDRWLDHPALLRWLSRHSHMTSPREHGAMTLAMLRPEHGGFGREMEELCDWLAIEKPGILCLSTALQAGMIRELKRRFDPRIVCFFQGEDGFLDGLPEPFRSDCWQELGLRVRDADLLVAPSAYYADLMCGRLDLATSAVRVLPNGINLDGYTPTAEKSGPPTIGFLARLCREKGLEIMVEAFIHLRKELAHPDARLVLAGTTTAENEALIASLKERLQKAGLTTDVRWMPDVSRSDKAAMLSSLTLFSVPAIVPEAFGLYVVEAMASGIPVVQPDAFSFPGIIGSSGSGALVKPEDPAALAHAWHDLLQQPATLQTMAENGRSTAERCYDIAVMRDAFLKLLGEIPTAPG